MTKAIEKTVMVFVVNEQNEVLLLRRRNTWFGNNEFAPPGGLVDTEETPEEAAIRECFEETNLSIENLSLISTTETHENPRVFQNHYFSTKTYSGDVINNEPSRHSELGWYPLDSLPENTMPHVRDIVKQHLHE